MIRKFTNITCIYYSDKNYIPMKFNCPSIEVDDVILKLTVNKEQNYEKISEFIVDYAFAIFCNNAEIKDFSKDYYKYKRSNWKLLDFTEITNKSDKNESTGN